MKLIVFSQLKQINQKLPRHLQIIEKEVGVGEVEDELLHPESKSACRRRILGIHKHGLGDVSSRRDAVRLVSRLPHKAPLL